MKILSGYERDSYVLATKVFFPISTLVNVAARYTAEKRIVAHGGSAGGMLMGAVANLAPELFAGILADVPFVDSSRGGLASTLTEGSNGHYI